MKKLKIEEIIYSVSGAFLFALMFGALLQSLFNLRGITLLVLDLIGFLGCLIVLIIMNAKGEN
jgi:hypothetical protein